MAQFDIIRLAHAEFCVTDLEKARDFYVGGLGFIETESDANHIYLRALEDANHHCLVLTKAEKASLHHISYRVGSEDELDRLAQLFLENNLPVRWLAKDEERGQGRAIRIQDPSGIPVEFFCEMEKVERMLQKFTHHRAARVKRIDHANCLVTDINMINDWYMNNLGFRCSEYTVTGAAEEETLWASWLHRKPSVHDLALINESGPRVHHIGFWIDDAKTILDACDHLAAAGYSANIERSPGRHGTSNAFFVYVRDPDGHRIELYTGDYFTNDPDWEPVKWHLSDPQRATFWGTEPPYSWKTEAMPVQHILTGELMEITEPLLHSNHKK
ncbi:3,4-dihydroxyphenylacetate 2,3-dioxygenase [Aneurinibacillus uraniidurans]|uniref:3,4-dihydroxyphenylacetate 2,3-dioxygenase n=1 Tax=Aneurinibacillus uraniidurans TaxID=2966586 RepID=UPI00234918A6|nr:3,4-dihydroxyphenylacetate 2,3-dioxygenase [Aneurinibacillus sp. B1]WCN37091.1 3,4-dihydroxyphenylacetate 2,3-dioxygenase [Aneurinibacillus sp. B1]